MTVVVYRDGVLAADTAEWMGGEIIVSQVEKIHRTPHGAFVACCGRLAEIQRFRRWADGNFEGDCKAASDGFGAIVLMPDGVVRRYVETMDFYVSTSWQIAGCHGEFLAGALAAGASAEQAVSLAIKHCCYAGGRVTTARVGD